MMGKAVVCPEHLRAAVRKLFPEHKILVPGQAVAGHRFGQIVMLWTPGQTPSDAQNAAEVAWVDHNLRCRLAPGGEFVHLV